MFFQPQVSPSLVFFCVEFPLLYLLGREGRKRLTLRCWAIFSPIDKMVEIIQRCCVNFPSVRFRAYAYKHPRWHWRLCQMMKTTLWGERISRIYNFNFSPLKAPSWSHSMNWMKLVCLMSRARAENIHCEKYYDVSHISLCYTHRALHYKIDIEWTISELDTTTSSQTLSIPFRSRTGYTCISLIYIRHESSDEHIENTWMSCFNASAHVSLATLRLLCFFGEHFKKDV